jgi:hypothetical protein
MIILKAYYNTKLIMKSLGETAMDLGLETGWNYRVNRL